jgi:hypothetical protein
LLEDELLYEEAEVMQRLKHWGKGRLQEEVSVMHPSCPAPLTDRRSGIHD